MNLAALVDAYEKEHKPGLDAMLRGFAGVESLEKAIEIAASGKLPNGELHCHQWRLKKSALHEAAGLLGDSIADIRNCTSFDELIALVETKTKRVVGFGRLAQYDTALRIGACLNKHPDRVYLHSGTRKGARALSKIMHLNLQYDRPSLPVAVFPAPLRSLAARDIEAFLCIYRKQLAGREDGAIVGCGARRRNERC